MKISCHVTKDLLPLYHDAVLSSDSKRLVEEHLADCDSCKTILDKIKDNTIDNRIKSERTDIIGHHAKTVKRKSFITGVSIAGFLLIPILVCLIVNLATLRTLDWFFIVLASLMILASVTVVPLIFEKKKGLWTLGCFTGSLLLLLMTCAIYTRGEWFFVAAVSVLLGLSILFAPYILSQLNLTGSARHHKGLIAMALNTLMVFAVIIASGFFIGVNILSDWYLGLLSAFVALIFPWGLFLIIRYLKANAFIKAGLSFIFGGCFLSYGLGVMDWILDGTYPSRFKGANLLVWNIETLNPNIFLLILLSGLIIGGILLLVGRLLNKKGKGE
ncbi:MAG: zf-HC2 domain-containing protein [Lachnospiraceae bacterium]|nr:zf-HC2 domain-containing protein [Lachnospiraceae bacterium]